MILVKSIDFFFQYYKKGGKIYLAYNKQVGVRVEMRARDIGEGFVFKERVIQEWDRHCS